jgi:hypothetical protein
MSHDFKKHNFFLVLCKTRKKLDKYMKINRIRNKYIIDIKKIIEELEIETYEEIIRSDLLKLHLMKRINMAKEKKKDIYYIPYYDLNKKISKVFNLKNIIEKTHNFNLLYFYDDFDNIEQQQTIMNRISEFDLTQILKDY